jgi:hypothetical protein
LTRLGQTAWERFSMNISIRQVLIQNIRKF